MMKLACKDLDSSSSCNFEATGYTTEEVAKKMMAHAKVAHPESVKGMSDDNVISMMELKVHN